MTRGKPMRVRCPKCEVGAVKHGPGYSLVRTGATRKRWGRQHNEIMIELRCTGCNHKFFSRHPRAIFCPGEIHEEGEAERG